MAYTEEMISIVLGEDHTLESSTNIIGRAGEGNAVQFIIEIPENLAECSVYLDFEKPDGEKIRTPALDVGEDGTVVYDVAPYLLTDDGEIRVQAVLKAENGMTWKSFTKKYIIERSINATVIVPVSRDVIEIDLSKFESDGEIVEVRGDGTRETTTITFDENGKPTKITDEFGNELTLTWEVS